MKRGHCNIIVVLMTIQLSRVCKSHEIYHQTVIFIECEYYNELSIRPNNVCHNNNLSWPAVFKSYRL